MVSSDNENYIIPFALLAISLSAAAIADKV
jgi:hypothetical protein